MLTTLIQDENRERINVYLKIFYENYKNFKEPMILPCMKASTYSPASDNVGFQVLGNSIKTLDI